MRRSVRSGARLALTVVAAIIGPIALALLMLTFVPAVRSVVFEQAIVRVRAKIPGQITYTSGRWTSLGGLEFENLLWVDPPDTLARADRIVARVDLPRLLHHDLHVRELSATGLRADFVAVKSRFHPAPKDTLQKGGGFFRPGSLPGAPSMSFDRVDVDAPYLRLSPSSTLTGLALHGSADLLQGSRPRVHLEGVRFLSPEDGTTLEDVSLDLDLAGEGRLDAHGTGRIGEEWPFRIEAATEPGGRWRFSMLRTGANGAGGPAAGAAAGAAARSAAGANGAAGDAEPQGEGIVATGEFRRDGRRLSGLVLDASLDTPGTRTLATFPSLKRAFEGLPDLEGVRGRVRGEMSFAHGHSGNFQIDFERNRWMSGGSAALAYAPGRVSVDTLSLGFLDLDVSGHWWTEKGAQDGSVIAHARGTRWMRPFVPPSSVPDSLVFDLSANAKGPSNDIDVTALVSGGMRHGATRLQDVALAARGSTAPGSGVRFRLAGIASGLDVRASGIVERGSSVRARLDPVVLLEANARAPRPAITLPPAGPQRSGLDRTLRSAAAGEPTIDFDPGTKRFHVHGLRVEGDYGDAVVDGDYDAQAGGSFGADVSWPEAPAFLLRRVRSSEAARGDLARRWAGGGRFGLSAEAHLLPAGSAMETRVAGTMRLPGPAVLAPLLPPGAQVNDLGPVSGRFDFHTLPGTANGWTFAADLDRNGWIETLAMRAHGGAAATVLDSLDARLLGTAIAASGRAENGTLAGAGSVHVMNGDILRILNPGGPSTDARIDLDATVGGTTRTPEVAARFAGRFIRPGLVLDAFDGDARTAGNRLLSARLHAAKGADVSTVHFDSLLAVFRSNEAASGPLDGRMSLWARGPDLSIVQAAAVRQDRGWTISGDTLTIVTSKNRDLRAQKPYEIRAGDGAFTVSGLDLRGTLGSIQADLARQGDRSTVHVTADLRLADQPSWATVPPGLWPATVRARIVQQPGDSVLVNVVADGLQIGQRTNVRATLSLTGLGDRSQADIVLQNRTGRFAEAQGVLPGTLEILPVRLPSVEGPLHFDVALHQFPLPPNGGDPMTAPGYLDRGGVDRSPVLDARGTVRGTASAPVATLLGVVTFPGYNELRGYRVLAKAVSIGPGMSASQGAALLSAGASDSLSSLAAEARALELPSGGNGVVAAFRGLDNKNAEFFHGTASYPIDWALRPAHVRMTGQPIELLADSNGLPLNIVQPFIEQTTHLDGRATFHLAGSGPAKNPSVQGDFSVSNVSVALQDGTSANGSGKLHLSGTLSAPVVEGSATVQHGTIVIPTANKTLLPTQGRSLLWEGSSYVQANENEPNAANQVAERRTGNPAGNMKSAFPGLAEIDTIAARQAAQAETTWARPGPLQNADINVALHVPTGVWLQGHGMNVLLSGDLTMTQKHGRPAFLGVLRATEGYMSFQGRRLDVERGLITFYGGEEMNPSLDLSMVKHQGNVTIHANISGTLNQPSLELTSDPEMAEADIFSYLLFGRPSAKLDNGQQTALEGSAIATAQEFAASQLTARLSQQLDLDMFSFQAGGQDSLSNSVTFGKYLSPKLLVKYQQDIQQTGAYELILQYWLKGGLKLETHMRRTESGAALTWSKDY